MARMAPTVQRFRIWVIIDDVEEDEGGGEAELVEATGEVEYLPSRESNAFLL